MAKPMQIEEPKITILDVRIAVAILICFLVSTALSHAGFLFYIGERPLEIIQKMTACIACLLCCQDNLMISRRSGEPYYYHFYRRSDRNRCDLTGQHNRK